MAKSWEEGVVDAAVKDLRKTWGHGWDALGTDLREALLARKVLAVIAGQVVGSTDPKAALDDLLRLARAAVRAEV